MAETLMQVGVFALIAGILFRFPRIGMLVHPAAKQEHKTRAWEQFFGARFKFTAQSFFATGAGLLTLGIFTLGSI